MIPVFNKDVIIHAFNNDHGKYRTYDFCRLDAQFRDIGWCLKIAGSDKLYSKLTLGGEDRQLWKRSLMARMQYFQQYPNYPIYELEISDENGT